MKTDLVRSRLVKKRIEAGLSVTAAAKKIHCHHATLSKKESGERRIYLEDLIEMSKAYQCPISDFFYDVN